MKGKNTGKMPFLKALLVIAIILAVLSFHPVTRVLVIWILPLGAGIPDLVGTGCLIVVLLIVGYKTLWFGRKTKKILKEKWDEDDD